MLCTHKTTILCQFGLFFVTSLLTHISINSQPILVGIVSPVKRSSKKRARGMPVWKNQSITRDVYWEYLIQKLLPAIKQKWPMNNGRIWLQQDGAKSHILDDDEEFKEAVDDIGLNLTVYTQSPNSPDINILDLGFFTAIQSFNDDCPAK